MRALFLLCSKQLQSELQASGCFPALQHSQDLPPLTRAAAIVVHRHMAQPRFRVATLHLRCLNATSGGVWTGAIVLFSATTSSRFAPSSLRRKNIPVLDHPKSPLKLPPSRPARGALAIVTNVGAGCGGRGSVGREVCSQGELNLMSKHGAQTTGAEAYGKTVWSRHPWLVPSCRWRVRSNRIGGPSSRQRRRQDEFVSGESAA
jgi:hypothetical protein